MLILASNSPRRKEIMRLVGLDFKVVVSDYEETKEDWPNNIYDIPQQMAINKANVVAKNYPNDIIIGSDTVVIINGIILGKPIDTNDAIRMLHMLAGNIHEVVTAVCIIAKNKQTTFTSIAKVEFYPMTDEEINLYVASNEPMDKAGAYAIQGIGAQFIKKIDGDYYTVMGLPIAKLCHELKKIQQ